MPAESPTSCSTCHMPYFTAVLGGAARTNLGALWLVRNKAMCFIQRYTFKKSLHERVCESDCSDRRGDHTCDGWSLEASQRHLMQCSWSTRQMASQCNDAVLAGRKMQPLWPRFADSRETCCLHECERSQFRLRSTTARQTTEQYRYPTAGLRLYLQADSVDGDEADATLEGVSSE